MKTTKARLGLAAGAIAVVAAALAAGTAGTAAAAAPSGLSAADQALFAYARCMRDKGVKIPDPVKGKDGRYAFPPVPASITGAAGVRAKAQECAQSSGALNSSSSATVTDPKTGKAIQRPTLTGGPGGEGDGGRFRDGGGFRANPAFQAAFQKFQACLAKAGVTLPQPGGRPPAQPRPATTTAASPARKGSTAGGEGFRGGSGGDRGGVLGSSSDPKLQAAFEKCRSLLPQPPEGFGPGGRRPGTSTSAAATTTTKKA